MSGWVGSSGSSTKEAYKKALTSESLGLALAHGIGFDELSWDLFARTFEEVVGRPTQVDKALLASATSPENFVAVREMPGGPGPRVLRVALAGYMDRLACLKSRTEDVRKRIAQADALRDRLVSNFIAGEV